MKSLNMLIVAAACTLATNVTAERTTFHGAGSTLLGQTTFGPDLPSDNRSLSVLVVKGYNLVNNTPQFTYNEGTEFDQDSTAGINQTFLGTILFGGTDIAPARSLVCPEGPLLNWPVAVAGLAITYNLPNQTLPLELTPQNIADIFSGQFLTWGAFASANPNARVNTADQVLPLTVLIRNDSSGETGMLTQYLTATRGQGRWTLEGNGPFTPDQWRNAQPNKPGTSFIYELFSSVTLMLGLQRLGDTLGIIGLSKPGAIGYLGYNNLLATHSIKPNNSNIAAIARRDAPGFVLPSAASLTAAARNLGSNLNPQLLYNTIFSSNTDAYPIANPTNLVTLACQFSASDVLGLRKFLLYYLKTAQDAGKVLGFGKLPIEVYNQFLAQFDCMRYSEDCTTLLPPIAPCCAIPLS